MSKRILNLLTICVACLCISFLLVSCGKNKISITGISTLVVGNSTTLTATLEEELETDEEVTFIWESEKPSVATVDDTGLVCGIAPGETTIYASYKEYTGKFQLKVISKNMANKQVLKSPEVISSQLLTGEKIEIAIHEVEEGYVEQKYNPYDYTQINVYGVFISPTGKEIVMPAFWYRDYEIKINTGHTGVSSVGGVASTNPDEIQGLETVSWTDSPLHYRLRVSLDEVGEYTYSINVEENGELVQYIESKLTVENNKNSNNRGIIQVDSNTNRNFIDGLGNSFIPVGVNLCWWTNNSRKTYDYDVWFEAMNQNNLNMARLWMATWGFSLHWGKSYNNFDDRLNMAARLDKVMNLADENDIYIQLCFVNHGQFSSTTNSEWGKNPYNVKNGGIIESPAEFFSNEECKKTFKNEMTYIVARYGYSDKIMAWELFNEVDWTDGADSSNRLNIYNWHKQMGEYLNSIDPYDHMITTSYKTNTGMAYSLGCIDYTCPHDYGYSNKNITTNLPSSMQSIIDKYKKPTMQSEVGINWESGTASAKVDPTGISIRQALWAGMMGGTAGAAMNWWWDSWIHPNNLWTVYNGAGLYAKEMDLTGTLYTKLKKGTNFTSSNEKVDVLGYLYDDRVYGYLFDNTWWYVNSDVESLDSNITINVSNGDYTLRIYDTVTGEVKSTSNVTINNGQFELSISFCEDAAFILEKNKI